MGLEGTELPPGLIMWLVLAAIPVLLVVATAFTKATVVLGALRVGLGAEALIPLGLVLAVALVITAVIMGPVLEASLSLLQAQGGFEALWGQPYQVWLPLLDPLRGFVAEHASSEELRFFAELQNRSQTDPLVLVPAFLVTELTEALTIAVLIITPFLLVDLLAAQALMLMGLVQQPIPLLTLPLKLLLFLSVGGWDVVLGGLVEGYQ